MPERLEMARAKRKVEAIDFTKQSVYETLTEMPKGGRTGAWTRSGHSRTGSPAWTRSADKVKAAVMLETERPHMLRQAIMSCRKGGTLSTPGVYVGFSGEVLLMILFPALRPGPVVVMDDLDAP